MIMKHCWLIPLFLFLSGCAHNPTVMWFHPERDFKEDRMKCASINPNNNFAQVDCLKKLGWKPLSGDVLKHCNKLNSDASNMLEKAQEDYKAFKKKIYGDKNNSEILLSSSFLEKSRPYKLNEQRIIKENYDRLRPCLSEGAYTEFDKKFEEFVKRYEVLYANRKKLEVEKITLEQFNQALSGEIPIDNLIQQH